MILINGQERDTIPVDDRGLAYGDGLFRTLVIRGGMPVAWRHHYRKLSHDCAVLGIPCPEESVWMEDLIRLSRCEPACVVKITVTRGRGARGYAGPATAQPTRILSTGPIPAYPAGWLKDGVRVHLCRMRLGHQPGLAGVKHLNRLENVLARMEWRDPGTAEGLLLDQEGNVIEGTMSNVFALRAGVLYTPDLGRCGVAGVTRDRIMALAPELALPLRVRNFPLPFLLQAEEVFLCNSVIGVWQVREAGEKTWDRGGLTGTIRRLLDEKND